MSGEWETLTPNRSTDGWEGGPTAAPAQQPGIPAQVAGAFGQYGIAAPVVAAAKSALGGINQVSDMAGSGVTEVASRAGLPPEAAAGLGVAANIGAGTAISGGVGKVATTAAPATRSAAEYLMQKAVKPTKADLISGDASKAINTMLDEGVFATQGGVAKLRSKIDDLNDEIKDAIKNSAQNVDKMTAYKNVKEALDTFSKQANPRADRESILKAWDEFNAEWPKKIPVELAQEIKQGTYRALRDKYGELSSAATEAQKAIARSMKEQIASAMPNVAKANAQESALINAEDVMSRGGVFTAGNKNVFGLGSLVNPLHWPLWLLDRSPLGMSAVARMLNAGQERIPQAAAGLTTAEAQALNKK
jgi:hypothetical protein